VLKQLSCILLKFIIHIYCVKQSPVKDVAVFDQISVVFESALGVCVHCHAVHHHWKKDQDDDFALLYDIDL